MITNQTSDFNNIDFNKGEVILVDKPLDWTSFNVVDKIRKTIKVKKVGHTGTLDPKATGLLIICTGAKTKTISSYLDLTKEYAGKIFLGKTTPTMDTESINEATEQQDTSSIDRKMIEKVSERFMGVIEQVPPSYSAIWVDGRRAYKLARKGREIKLEPRKVIIDKFKITDYDEPLISFEISCSKGTYVRKIASDLGTELGCGAFLYELRRTKIGQYDLNDAINIDKFQDLFANRVN
ncbi:MAG: tRNA pseudouridine(55) synthase TruB [Ignavibacteria bacterium]|nr:tRNA pseudouridine(55) synthase TruB [Ignavibacteria bacterium]